MKKNHSSTNRLLSPFCVRNIMEMYKIQLLPSRRLESSGGDSCVNTSRI